VYQSIAFDPLSSAVLGIQEIKEMTAKMFKQNRDYLPQFQNVDLR
jgi:alpha-galactosidase